MTVKNLAKQSSVTSGLFSKLALGVGALALLSTVLTYFEFGKEELPVVDAEAILDEPKSTQILG